MSITYCDEEKGLLKEFTASGIRVPFGKDLGPSFYFKVGGGLKPVVLSGCGGKYSGTVNGIKLNLSYADTEASLIIKAEAENLSGVPFVPDALGLKLGIDTYMAGYPQWNDVFFPTMLRCEKTHFWGYFMSPLHDTVVISCPDPVAAWELDYNKLSYESGTTFVHYGHRIHTANLLLLCRGPLPERHPEMQEKLMPGEKRVWEITLTPQKGLENLRTYLCESRNIPSVFLDKYTFSFGDTADIKTVCKGNAAIKTVTPSGKTVTGNKIPCSEYGVYTVTLNSMGKQCEAKFYCRHEYAWYLKNARRNAVTKPQKASTHTESWYGHFSALLAKKHFPDEEPDNAASLNFDEIMPLMFDFENGKPKVIPNRIQNTAACISLLVDAFESDTKHGKKYLDFANALAEDLLKRQTEDGAYRNGKGHYTAVIYIAKSILELALCEKGLADNPVFYERYIRHYSSVKAAVDDLLRLRESVGTEGEQTLEDGMISCACLQIGFFALTLPESEREPYIEAAEHLLFVHGCLEQNVIPDCRMHGATIRFWEAQYDVLIKGNMISSPHGWTSWKNYATYYLYLLTGKEEYLRATMDTVGTCMQSVDENGDLRWAFVCDPYLDLEVAVPDKSSPVTDGYESASILSSSAYRPKYERKVFGECYVDMISEWYRACPDGRVMGGYPFCSLPLEDANVWVDNQGGCCDNDVHEHFKCLEETVLGKAFVLVRDDGSLLTYSCTAEYKGDTLTVTPTEECDKLCINVPGKTEIDFCKKHYTVKKGITVI